MFESGGSARGAAGLWRIAWAMGRYALVGGVCFGLNIMIMYVGNVLIGIQYVKASLLTCLITIPVAYLLHRRITYRMTEVCRGQVGEFLRFLALQLLQYGAGLGILVMLVELGGLTPIWATIVMSALMFFGGFAANSTWVFRLFRRPRVIPDAPGPPVAPTPRLLQVSAFFPKHGGGVEVVAGEIARRLAASGMAVHWLAGGVPAERPDEVTPNLTIEQARSIDFLERTLGLPSPIWSPASLRRLWLAVRHSDIVHVHDMLYMPTLAAVLFAALARKPVVLTKHVGAIRYDSRLATATLGTINRTLGRWVLGFVDQAIFVGRPVMEYFERFVKYRRAPLLICNGVDHSVYREGPSPASVVAPGPLRCLFVGRFVEKKGLSLLHACVDLPQMTWAFIGWGPRSPITWGPYSDRLSLHENLRAEQVVPYYQSADLLVLPSRGEGFPLVVQEALACGTPVLVSEEIAEAFPEIDERCVFTVELRTANAAAALRNRLAALSQDPAKIRQARGHAASLARQWSWETCIDRYRAVYSSLMEPRRALAVAK